MTDEQIRILKALLDQDTYIVWWARDEGWRQLTGVVREHDDEMQASITYHGTPDNYQYIDLYNVSVGELLITSQEVTFSELTGTKET